MKQYRVLIPFFLIYFIPVGIFLYFLFDMFIQNGDMKYWVIFLLSLPICAVIGLISSTIIFFVKKEKSKFFKTLNLILIGMGFIQLVAGAIGYMLLYIVLA